MKLFERGTFGLDPFRGAAFQFVSLDLAPRCAIIACTTPATLTYAWCPEKETVMLINWLKDADAALAEAKAQNKPLLIDFSAAPA